ncbi:hypothetical protein C8F01DRAFT_1286363 [Mycena amicta]|nr:hypothetical protein C8F01DRAFT_1286363 [Mycena amicta]
MWTSLRHRQWQQFIGGKTNVNVYEFQPYARPNPPLPTEIIGLILEHLADDIPSLTATLQAGRQFRYFCEKLLFTHIDLLTVSTPNAFHRLARICERTPHIAGMIQSLTTYLPVTAHGKAASLVRLLNLLTNTNMNTNLLDLRIAPNPRGATRKSAGPGHTHVDFQALHPALGQALCDIAASKSLRRLQLDGVQFLPPAFLVLALSSARQVVLGTGLSLEWPGINPNWNIRLAEYTPHELGTTLEMLSLPHTYSEIVLHDRTIGPGLAEFLAHLAQNSCFKDVQTLRLSVLDSDVHGDWCTQTFGPVLSTLKRLELNCGYGGQLTVNAPPFPSCPHLTTLALSFDLTHSDSAGDSLAFPPILEQIVSELPELCPELESLSTTFRVVYASSCRGPGPWGKSDPIPFKFARGHDSSFSLRSVAMRLEQDIATAIIDMPRRLRDDAYAYDCQWGDELAQGFSEFVGSRERTWREGNMRIGARACNDFVGIHI